MTAKGITVLENAIEDDDDDSCGLFCTGVCDYSKMIQMPYRLSVVLSMNLFSFNHEIVLQQLLCLFCVSVSRLP